MNHPSPAPPPSPSSAPAPTKPKPSTSASGFLRPEARYIWKFDTFTKNYLRSYLDGKQEAEIDSLANKFTVTLACNYFIGVEDSERAEKLVAKLDDLAMAIHSMDSNFPGTIFYRESEGAAKLHKALEMIIEEKRVKMSNGVVMEDFLSQLLIAGRNQSGPKYRPPEKIVDTMMGLLTTRCCAAASVITFMVKYIGERQDIYQKILSEQSEIMSKREDGDSSLSWEHIYKMKYTYAVTCETMRRVAPLQGTFREAIADIYFAGFTIPKGCKIYWAFNMTNKNPDYFPDPERFDPPRFRREVLVLIEKISCSVMTPTPAQGLPVLLHPL
ncbi:beta-amyrin 28-monooxygenase-like [Ziziphus jujuba]|uniref:Beta-amyrin 28-monooxygenase-like n=1 Tax=Ziziphus jujuba TaxID=326968 RepID=A0A6P6GGQ6_ZIZJJ|nr:beta-amyrin 28-monooxygenase-like [Ziziphus jujuba]